MGALSGVQVLDLSRVVAGPWASQALGDLGADIIKVEKPGEGDDTRRWGPPFLKDGSGDSAYYLSVNRNKRSIAVDITRPKGAEIIRRLAAKSDVLLENFRAGGLAKYGLDEKSLRKEHPALVYCSVTGFGQDGPYRDRGGYDFLIQGMSGLMSITGAPDGPPTKVGVAISDLFTGLYATIAILAALHHRQTSGEGQHIDCALLDSQVAVLLNQASNFLNGGRLPQRLGNQHPNVVPYQTFPCADGEVLVAIGNTRQFQAFCRLIDREDLASDARYQTDADRSDHRETLVAELGKALALWPVDELLARMAEAKLPGGRVNDIPEMLIDPQVLHRGLVQEIARPDGTPVRFLGFPAHISATPASYRLAPPRLGADTVAVLGEVLGMAVPEMEALAEAGIIALPARARKPGIAPPSNNG